MDETPPASAYNLEPLHVVYKRSSPKDPRKAVLDVETGILRIEPALVSEASPEPQLDSLLNLSTPLTTSVRGRPGNEFTLVLKYRVAAESSAQKEAWLAALSALGIGVRTLLSAHFPLYPSSLHSTALLLSHSQH